MILCDTGPLVAAALRRDPDHHACVELFTGLRLAGRRLLLPPTVIAEVGYMIQTYGSLDLEAQFLESVAAGDFEAVELVAEDYARIVELVKQYVGFPLGVTDASVIALAERLGVSEIATLDHRHFRGIEPRHVKTFTLQP
jgi:predicted nucleic acid-binding protein